MSNELNISKEKMIEFRDNLYAIYSEVGKALSHPIRLMIIDFLSQDKSYTVEEIANEIMVSVVSVSQHLQILKRSGLLKVTRQGVYMYYTLTDNQVYSLLNSLKKTTEKVGNDINNTVKTYFSHRNEMEEISLEDLITKINDQSVLLIDLRKSSEYEVGHIDNAKSIPYDILPEKINEITDEKQIVVYCRGEYCICSDHALIWLKNKGIKALRLSAGYPDWKVFTKK